MALAFDAFYQGESEGEPRFLDNPMNRIGDIYSAVDYLVTLPYVDADRIGALGLCAGSGATVKAAMTERRIKAVATVGAVNVGALAQKGWDGKASATDQIATLEAVGKQRTAEATGSAPLANAAKISRQPMPTTTFSGTPGTTIGQLALFSPAR